MKKAFVLLLALAVLGGAAFAEDVGFTLTGSASLIWGFDLNTENHGFTNSADATLTVPLIAKQSATKGEEAITGQITIKNFEYKMVDKISGDPAQTMTAGSIEAKILFPSNLYLQIASKPTFEVAYADLFAPVYVDAWEKGGKNNPSITSAGGFTFGMTGDFNFALMVGSTNKHTDVKYTYTAAAATVNGVATANQYYYESAPGVYTVVPTGVLVVAGEVTIGAATYDALTRSGQYATDEAANDYHFGAGVGYKLGDLATVNAKFIYGSFDADPAVVGLGFEVLSTPIDNLSLRLGADFEFTDETVAKGLMDFSFKADYTLPELVTLGAGAYLGLDTEGPDTGDLVNPAFNLMGRVSLLAVENLTLKAGIDIIDLLDNTDGDKDAVMLISADAAYTVKLDDVNYLKPYFGLAYKPEANDVNPITTMKAGVEAMFFPLTTFGLEFKAGKFDNDTYAYTGKSMGSSAKADKGVITFTTKISY